ncbi:hypothetical protein [Rhodovulum marinum]|uniref:hypothetical protein n=1 Tax=Rhodovulum marinum TaxID=320662 RepID=UPI0010434265|nr:hypothetical protein [Rhodovulum marinum]
MNFSKSFRRLSLNEAGAVSVEWVMLTALVSSLCLGIIPLLRGGSGHVADEIAGVLEAGEVQPLSPPID